MTLGMKQSWIWVQGMDVDDMDRDTGHMLPNSGNPHLINQAKLNDPVQELNLREKAGKASISGLERWNYVEEKKVFRFS
jgi:hypothetical protein